MSAIPHLGNISNISRLGGGGFFGKTPFLLNISSNGFSPADAAVVYMGVGANSNGTSLGAGDFKVYVPTRCRIRKIYGRCRITVGSSSETSVLNILTNGTTATPITSALNTVGSTAFSKTDLDIVLNDGEYFCFRLDCNTRATNPTISIINATILCEPIPSISGPTYIQFGNNQTFNPAASTTYYLADNNTPTTAGTGRTYITKAGTITECDLFVRCGTAGSNEQFTYAIRLNNTTDYNITTTAKLDTVSNLFQSTSLSIPVVAGDYIELKQISPARGTPPLTVSRRFNATVS